MAIFDSFKGQISDALSKFGNNGNAGMMETVAGLINNPETGGIQGLIDNFKTKGLGDSVTSWIGTGQNLPISGDQIRTVLGSGKVQAIAQKLGLSESDAANHLASLMPQVIDKLTPNGEVPDNNILEQGLAMLKGFGK